MVPKRISITFQGGFVGTKCSVNVRKDSDSTGWETFTHIYPEDVNRRQIFDLQPEGDAQSLAENGVESIKLVFEESSDFFGRIIIYCMKIEGFAL